MRILKKSLACLLVAIIAMTAMFGCLVSAEETTINGTISVWDTTVHPDAESFEVYVDVAAESAISVARVKVNVPAALGTIASATVEGEGVKAFDVEVPDEDYNLADGVFLVEASDWSVGYTAATITLTITPAADVAAGTYAVTAENITDVEGADWSENPCTFEITNADVIVPYVITVGGDAVTVTLAAGETATVMADYGAYIAVEGEGATVTYNGVEQTEDFQLSMMTRNNTFTVANNTESEITVVLSQYIPLGAKGNPEVIEAGDHTATIAEGSDGYYYTYIATADGTVKVTMPTDKGWVYVINNLTAGTYGDTQWSDSDPVVNPGTVEVAKDDVLEIMVNTYDPASPWTAPAGEINWNLTLEEAVTGPVEDLDIEAAAHSVSIGDTFGIMFRYKLSSLKAEYKSFSLDIKRVSADNSYNFTYVESSYANDVFRSNTNQDLLMCTSTYYGVELYSTTAPIEYTLHCYDADGNELAYCTKTTTLADIAIAYHDSTTNTKVQRALADLIQVGAAALNHFTANRTKSCDYSTLPVPTIESDYITTELGTLNAVNSGEGIAITLAAGVKENPYFTMRFTEDIANKAQYHYEISYYNAVSKTTVTNTVDSTTMTGNASTIFTSFKAIPMYASNSDVTFELYKEGVAEPVATYHYSLEAYYETTLANSSNATLKAVLQELGELAQSFRAVKGI